MADKGISSPGDDNRSTAILATNSTDITRPVLLYSDPDTHALYVSAPVQNILSATSIAYESSHLIKSVSGKLFGLTGYNSKGTTQFIQLFDAKSLPADGAVPQVIFSVSAVSNFSLDYSAVGRPFLTGIVICNSSTGPTKTLGSADTWFDVQYI